MKSEKLLRALNDLPEDLIDEAAQRRRRPITRIAALAACFVVLLAGMYPFLRGISLQNGNGDNSGRDVVRQPGADTFTYQGCWYSLYEDVNSAITDRLELPCPVPDSLIGSQLDTLTKYGTIYAYAPLEGKTGTAPAVLYLLDRGDGDWWYMIFDGLSDGAYAEAATLLQFYGVTSGADIVSLAPNGDPENGIDGDTFYRALCAAPVCDSKEFHSTLFAGVDEGDEEAWQAREREVFAGSALLRLETEAGVVSYMTYYPAIGYVEWDAAYYQVGDLS